MSTYTSESHYNSFQGDIAEKWYIFGRDAVRIAVLLQSMDHGAFGFVVIS